ncbi:FMN-dependent NADH-azoreductase [Roseateles sp. P5_E11]
MSRLLHIQGSPNPASTSREIAEAFVARYRAVRADAQVEVADVWQLALPEFDADMIAAKFAVLRSQQATNAQCRHWARAVALAEAFNRADHYVINLPMWNLGLPYRLKHYIDVVTLPGQNWAWQRDTGYRPLLSGKRAVLVYSSASDYGSEGHSAQGHLDTQKAAMRAWLGFLGIKVAQEIVIAPTLTDPTSLAALKQARRAQAEAAAERI